MNSSCLQPHPDNPHYFSLDGKPTVLITSGEHYGAVINLEFDYREYLAQLRQEGFNHTRLFVGAYREAVDEWWPFNSLGPRPGKYVCPFARSAVAGARDGGSKFDLSAWDETFFARLRNFCRLAGEAGVVVEATIFCPFYANAFGDRHWALSPWHPDNNVNGLEAIAPAEALSLQYPRLLKIQEAMLRRVVAELNPYGHLYFEVCNEPYHDRVSMEWHSHMARLIAETESALPNRHLVSWNVANGSAVVADPDPAISIFNFHYPRPEPTCVVVNYGLNKPIGCNETGFDGAADEKYRVQAWQFMLSGGAPFNHLDPSFHAGAETGAALPEGTTNFGGGPTLRRQLRILKDFIESFDFVRLHPANGLVLDASGAAAYLLAEEGRQYALYLRRDAGPCPAVTLRAPDGGYEMQVVDTDKGPVGRPAPVTAEGGRLTLALPAFERDVAARVVAVGR